MLPHLDAIIGAGALDHEVGAAGIDGQVESLPGDAAVAIVGLR